MEVIVCSMVGSLFNVAVIIESFISKCVLCLLVNYFILARVLWHSVFRELKLFGNVVSNL